MHWHWLPWEVVKPPGHSDDVKCWTLTLKMLAHVTNNLFSVHDEDDDDNVDENHLIASVGGNIPARFAWADIKVLSMSVLLTQT